MKILKKWYSIVGIFVLIIILLASGGDKKQEEVASVNNQVVEEQQVTEDVATPSSSVVTTPEKVVPVVTSNEYKVTEVVDGDTVRVNINGIVETIRIMGLNTPETVDPRKEVECFGKEASNKAKELLTGKSVTLEADATQGERDKYGRLLRFVYLPDGTDYGKYMISQGFAYEYTYSKPYKYQTEYKAAQNSAEASKLGLWAPNACPTATTTPTPVATAAYYTSSFSTSKYYYPASCEAWKGLDSKYLKSFATLEALHAKYPSRTLSPSCK